MSLQSQVLGLYFLGLVSLGFIAYDLTKSKNTCESMVIEYVQAEAMGLKGAELQPAKERMEGACKLMQEKAKAVESVSK